MDISNITRMISAFRAQTSPNSITPEGLGSILQHIANMIGALSQINTSEATDLIARVSEAEANAETARQAAQNALTASEANVVDSFTYEQTDRVLQLLLKQHGHETHSINLPGATTTFAGLLTAIDKYHLDVAYDKRLKDLYTTKTPSTVTLNFKKHDDTVDQVTFVAATSTDAGLMTAEDKSKLISLESTIRNIQDWQQTFTSKFENEVAHIDSENGRIVVGCEHPVLLYGMGAGLDGPDAGSCPVGGSYWDPEQKMIWNRVQPRVFLPISPSQSVVYTNFYTGKKYAWVPDGQEGEMVEVSDLTENMPSGSGMPMSDDVYQAIQLRVEALRSILYALTKTWLANLAFTNGRPSDSLLSSIASQFTWPANEGGSSGGDTPTGDPSLTVYVDGVAVANGSTINVGTNTGNGVSKTITIKGSNLTSPVSLTMGTSTSGLSVSPTSIAASQVMAASGATATISYSGSIASASGRVTISSGSANVTLLLTASYQEQGGGDEPGQTPTIDVSPSSLSFNAEAGQSAQQTFTVQGSNLTGDIQLSSSNDLFTCTVISGSLSPTNGIVDATVTVTYRPNAAGTHSGTITASSTGAVSQTVSLSGTATAAASTINVVYKLLNFNQPSGTTQDQVWGYYKETTDKSTNLSKTLSAINNATLRGDLTVKSGGVVLYKQGGSNNNSGITFSNGVLSITSTVLNSLTDDLIVEATAYTGKVIITASEAVSGGVTINGTAQNLEQRSNEFNASTISSLSFATEAKTKITSIDFGGAQFTGTTLASMFSGFTALTQVKGLVVTGSVTSLASLFSGCSALTSFDTIGWDTSAVTTIEALAYNCTVLTKVDLGSKDMSSLTSAGTTDTTGAFGKCSNLANFDVSHWNAPNLTSLRAFLYQCTSLTKFDASTWNTPKVANMWGMFASCSALTEIDISGIDTTYANAQGTLSVGHLFHLSQASARNLSKLTIGKFDTSNVATLESFFWYACGEKELELHCKSAVVPSISSDTSKIWFRAGNTSASHNGKQMVGSVYVPTGHMEDYQTAWSSYLSSDTTWHEE